MSIKIIGEVWKLSQVTPSEKLVLLAIADKCGHCGHGWVSYSTLAKMTCLTEASVKRIVKKLLADDHLRLSKFKWEKHQNIYSIMREGYHCDTAQTFTCINCNLKGVSPRYQDPFLDPSISISQDLEKLAKGEKFIESISPGFLDRVMNGRNGTTHAEGNGS